MRKFLIISLILLTYSALSAQSKVGSTAAPFLNIGVGPRAISMGGAFIAHSNDVSALYWNPAGIANLESNQAMFSSSKWFADITYNWAGASLYLGDMGAVGLNVTYLDYGQMEVTTLAEQEGTGEMFDAIDISMGLTYAFRLTNQFTIGGTVKYINQKIWNTSASSVAVDLGILFQSDLYGLRIGATITNFGSDMKMDGKDLYVLHDIDQNNFGNNDQVLAKLNTDSYPLPLTFKVGLGMDVLDITDHKVTIGIDAIHPSDNDEAINVGMEYQILNLIALRGGYKSLLLTNSEEGLTLGFGVKYDFNPALGIYFDYAYQNFGILDNTQHFSIGVKF